MIRFGPLDLMTLSLPRAARIGWRGRLPVSVGTVRFNKRIRGGYVRVGPRGYGFMWRLPPTRRSGK